MHTRQLLLAFLVCGAAPLGAASFARIDSLSGFADRRDPGQIEWQGLNPSDRLSEGVSLRTAADARVDLVTDSGHRITVKPNSLFTLTRLDGDITEGRLEQGRVLSKVRHLQTQQRFAIATPSAVCAVRGTEFETAVQDRGTWVAVYKGVVGFALAGGGPETAVHAGEMSAVRDGSLELPRPISQSGSGSADAGLTREAKHEVGLDMSRNEVIAAAALEQRMADYTEGKTLIDATGARVRVEEYIVRPQANQFKFVVLNERQDRFDYFFYKGTFNQNLPADLSVALRDLSGKYGTTAPDYYLTGYEMAQSNTQDTVHDTAAGGHLVKITMDASGDYLLTDNEDPTHTRTVQGAQLQGDGTYKVYNPLADSFSTVTADQKDAASHFGIYIPQNDSFRDLAPGDTFWKTRFNSYTHALNNATKISYVGATSANVLATTLDATYTYAGGFVLPVVTVDANHLDVTIQNNYGDGTTETYRTVLMDDQGHLAPANAFDGVATGAQYKGELLKWNYEQQVTATEFGGRKIDLVVEPKIFIKSGLIQ